MLWPLLEPIISVRSIGEAIGEGTTPASVIADVIEGVKSAMRILVQQVREEFPTNASAAIRRLYDLPTQKFAFNSFEVAFRLPDEDTQTKIDGMEQDSVADIYRDVGKLLNKGIDWLSSDSADPNDMDVPEEARPAVLEALEKLIPSYIGPVKMLEIGGRLVGPSQIKYGGPIQIHKDAKTVVRAARRLLKLEEERILKGTGYIRELDKDRYTFELRDDSGMTIAKFSFLDDISDKVSDAHYQEYPVEVIAQGSPTRTPRALIVQKLDKAPVSAEIISV